MGRIAVISLLASILTMFAGGAEAQSSPQPVKGICSYGSQRLIILAIKSRTEQLYTQAGYKNVKVRVAMKLPRVASSTLTAASATNLSVGPKAGEPFKLQIQGGSTSAPVEVGCAMEVPIEVGVRVTNASGAVQSGINTSKIMVRGWFR